MLKMIIIWKISFYKVYYFRFLVPPSQTYQNFRMPPHLISLAQHCNLFLKITFFKDTTPIKQGLCKYTVILQSIYTFYLFTFYLCNMILDSGLIKINSALHIMAIWNSYGVINILSIQNNKLFKDKGTY